MENGQFLAKSSAGNVSRCPGGCIHLNIPGVSLHLTELQFITLSRLMQDASTCLLDGALKSLLDDTN